MLTNFTVTLTGNVIDDCLTNRLNHELDFSHDQYEVCMLDMLFMPGSWDNVRPGKNSILFRDISTKDVIAHMTVPPKNYIYLSDLFKAINAEPPALFTIRVNFKKLKIRVPGNARDKIEMQFCSELAYLLGIITTMTAPVPWVRHMYTADMAEIDIKRNNISKLWLFGNFVQNTMVGPLQLPLVRYVPIRVGSGVLEHAVMSLNQSSQVKRTQLSSLSITFREDVLGDILNVHKPVVMTLLFKIIDGGI